MRKHLRFFDGIIVVAVLALMMVSVGCSLDTGMRAAGGSIVIQIGSAASRATGNGNTTITPGVMDSIATFSITGTGPEGETFSASLTKGTNDNSLTRTNLAAGTWTFTVDGKTAANVTVATATTGNIAIVNNETANIAITLKPVAVGTGAFSLNATFTGATPAVANAVTGSIYNGATKVEDFTATWDADASKYKFTKAGLDTGTSYTVVVNAADSGGKVATNIFAMNVYPNCTSTLNMTYTVASFRVGSGTGSISITVRELAWDPTISFVMKDATNNVTNTITVGNTVTVTATLTPAADSLKWYLDGVEQLETGLAITTGSTVGPGGHVLTMIARKTTDGVLCLASDEVTFTVTL